MNLELRAIKHLESMSQETHCYTANLYLDGKKVAIVSNDGHGGSDDEHWLDNNARDKVHAYFKSLPKGKYDLDECLEFWCCEEVNKFLAEKHLKRVIKNKVAYVHNGSIYAVPVAAGNTVEKLCERIAKQNSDAIILNTLPSDKALELFRQYT